MIKQIKDNKYFQIGLTAFLVIVASILVGFFLFNLKGIWHFLGTVLKLFTPFLIGFVFAYLLNPIVKFFKKNFVSKLIKNDEVIINILSILITCLVFVLILILLFSIIIPDLLQSIEILAINLPYYFEEAKNYLLEKSSSDLQTVIINNYESINNYINNIINTNLLPKVELWLTNLSNGVIGAVKTIFNILMGFVIGIYYLLDIENFKAGLKKLLYSIFSVKFVNKLLDYVRRTDEIFSNFIVGKLLDSLIISLITFVFLAIFGYPYALLIAVIVGVTNIIPYFGPFIGAIPSALLILMVSPGKCLVFIIFIIVLQQFDGYLIGPKLCGSKTGLKSFWVLASIVFFGNAFGVIGMLIGVPIFALIYGYLDNIITIHLKEKELPTKTKDYIGVDRINSENKKVVRK